MSTEDNKAIVRRMYEEVWNMGNVAAADELFAPHYVNHFDSPTNVLVPERFQQGREAMTRAVPRTERVELGSLSGNPLFEGLR